MFVTRLMRRRQTVVSVALPVGRPLLHDLWSHIWWATLLRASAAVLFGIATLAWPRHTALALVFLFGVYALVDGAGALVISVRGGRSRPRWWAVAAGAVSIAAGVFALAEPRQVALVIMTIIGVWLILHGGAEIIGEPSMRGPRRPPQIDGDPWALTGREHARRDWSMLINGAMSALCGVGLILAPRIGALALIWAIGAWAVLHGVLMLPYALRLRRAAS